MKKAYARAGDCLYKSGGRLLLIKALLLLLLLLPVYFTIAGTASVLLLLLGEEIVGAVVVSAISTLLALAFSFFVAVPLVLGLFYLAHRLAIGEEAALSDLFYAFSARARYRAFLGMGRPLFVGCAVLYLLISFLEFAFYAFLPAHDLYSYLFALSAVALTLLGYLLLPLSFASLRRSLGRQGGAVAGLLLRLRFLPWILLGLATFGILLLCDVLPRLLIASAAPLHSNDIKEDGTSLSYSDK